MNSEVNKIKEIHPGVFWMLLDYPTSQFLRLILDENFQYVLVHNHMVGHYEWSDFNLPLFENNETWDIKSRLICFDFLISTKEFNNILPRFSPGIHAFQINKIPPDYLDINKIKGSPLYQILNECNWLFEFKAPGNDFGQILSPKIEFLQNVLKIISNAE